jgi:uncharacterized membrane protein SirB2
MYQPFPGSNQMPATTRPPVPQSVTRAAQAMYVGAVASLVGIVIDFLTRHSLRTALQKNDHKLTTSQLNNLYHVEIGVFIIVGLLAAGLWVWMAQSNKAGKSWARIVATVLFGIDTLSLIAGAVAPGGAGTRIYGIVVWVIGLVAIIFLWRRESTAFFKPQGQY